MRITYFLFLILAFSCSNKKQGQESNSNTPQSLYESGITTDNVEVSEENEYSDGTWCADVEYYNPNTGTRNTYNLDVEVENGELVQINWSNGGWLDGSHFSSEDISDGECSFTSDRGYRYTVTLEEKGGCGSSDSYRLRRDTEEEEKDFTCPECGGKKNRYDDKCDDCQDKDESCPKCYGYKMEWEQICSNCESEIEERRSNLEDEDFR